MGRVRRLIRLQPFPPAQGIHLTKRDMFYTDVKLFKDQVTNHSTLFSLACDPPMAHHPPDRNPKQYTPSTERLGRGAGRRGLHARLHALLPQRRGLGEGKEQRETCVCRDRSVYIQSILHGQSWRTRFDSNTSSLNPPLPTHAHDLPRSRAWWWAACSSRRTGTSSTARAWAWAARPSRPTSTRSPTSRATPSSSWCVRVLLDTA